MAVREVHGFVERVERRDRHDGAERLRAIELVVHRDAVDDGRVAEQARVGVAHESLARVARGDAAGAGRAADAVVRPDQLQPREEPVHEPFADHRAVEDVLRRIADRRLADRLVVAGHEVVVDVGVHDRDAERRAPLAGGAEPAEERTLDGEVEVGVGHHDERVLPTQLEARRLQVPAAELADPPADVGGAGEPDLVDQMLVERLLEPRERLRTVGEHHVERAVGESGVQEQLCERLGRGGGVLGRLPDDRVPAEQGRDQVPGRNGDREVPGRDDRRDAHRRAEREELLVRHLATARSGRRAGAPRPGRSCTCR